MKFKLIPLLVPLSTFVLTNTGVANPDRLEELVVTGELRDTNQLELANSVSIITDTLIEAQNARSLPELFNLTPNVNFAEGASRGRFIQIRGIGERSQFVNPINPSVGVVVDGIDFTGLSLGATTVDTEQVEIFRGPQGTLYGTNALAGLINVKGHSPSETTEGHISAGVGSFGREDLGAHFSTKLTEKLGWRIAVQQNKSDGYIDNTYLGRDDTNNIDELTLRNHLALDISEELQAELISYFIDVDNGYDAFSLDNDRTTLSDQPGQDKQKTFAHAFKLEYTGLNVADVQANISVADSEVEYGYDEDWSYNTICNDFTCVFDGYESVDNYERDNNNITADLRLLSKNASTDINWVIGTYYREQEVDLTRTYTFAPLFESEFKPTQLAIYGELDIPLTTRLTGVIGLRAEEYESDYSDNNGQSDTNSEDLFGGKVALEFDLDEDTLLYALISRGYKAGGFNPDPVLDVEDQQFSTEEQLNYEIGLKGDWLDNTVSAQFSYFFQQREDIQVNVSEDINANDDTAAPEFIIFLDNAAKGKNQGIEAEINWQANEQLSFYSSFGWLETEFTEFLNPTHINGDAENPVDLSGRDQAHAPNYQYFIAAQYDVNSALYFRVEFEGKDAFFFSQSHDERSSAYNLINARMGFNIRDVSLTLWGENITNQLTETRGFFFGNDPRDGYTAKLYSQKGAPRSFGVTASYHF